MVKKQNITIKTVAEDLANLERKVDDITDTLGSTQQDVQDIKRLITLLPTKDDLKVKDDIIKIKDVLREKLRVQI